MKIKLSLIVGLTIIADLGFNQTLASISSPLCEYQVYSPSSVYPYVYNSLIERSILPVDASYFNPDRRDIALIREGSVIGYIDFQTNQRQGETKLNYFDSEGILFASHVEQIYPCPTLNPVTRCYDSRLSTELDQSPNENHAPFRIVDGEWGVEYFRYGHLTNVNLWRGDFGRTLDWILNVYQSETSTIVLELSNPLAAFRFAVLNHPDISRLGDLVRIYETADYVVVAGTIPSNYVFDKIVSIAMGFGIYHIDMRVTIDGRLQRLGPIYPQWEGCLD